MKPLTVRLGIFMVGVSTSTAWSVGASGLASAQSLGEIARQESERRKTIVTSAQVITEADLKPERTPMRPVVATLPPAASATPLVAAPAYAMNRPPEGKYLTRDASYWLNRMRDLQTTHDRFRLQAAALKNLADSLTNDFESTWDRPRRATIESERQRIRTERALVGADLAAANKQIFDLEEEARRSNVPPGWLRP